MTEPEHQPENAEVVSAEIVPHSAPPPALFKTSDPVEVIEKATAVADALKGVLAKQGLTSTISGRTFVRVEGWSTLASMLGVNAVCTRTEKLLNPDDGEASDGFLATVEARMADGRVIGSADAICTRKEKTWKSRDDYALLSMAQTRATSKALRIPLGFIVTLAGYETTPAEEMPPDTPVAPEPIAPFGPAATGNTIPRTRNAIGFLLNGDLTKADKILGQLLEKVAKEGKSGEYLPLIACRAIGLIATELKESSEGLDEHLEGDPTAKQVKLAERIAAEVEAERVAELPVDGAAQ